MPMWTAVVCRINWGHLHPRTRIRNASVLSRQIVRGNCKHAHSTYVAPSLDTAENEEEGQEEEEEEEEEEEDEKEEVEEEEEEEEWEKENEKEKEEE